ncbi:MAG: hypothetical protein ACSLFP_17990 [Acidimicrobiales bacterium]
MSKPVTDQDEPREVGDRIHPPTTPDRDTIKEDRAAMDKGADGGRGPTPEEEAAADRTADSADSDVAESYEDMLEKGAAQEGEGKPGL